MDCERCGSHKAHKTDAGYMCRECYIFVYKKDILKKIKIKGERT